MVMKPARLPWCMFLLAFLDLTVHSVQEHSQHFELTDQNIALIDSVTIWDQKPKKLCTVRELQT